MTKTRVQWVGDKTFLGYGSNGHVSVMTGGNDGPGVSPMQMLLLGLGGCSGVDVVDILKKQRQPLHSLDVILTGERGEEYPKPWTAIHMHYVLVGDQLDPAKVERAINLSVEKYCGAHATLAGVAKITHDFEVLPIEAPSA